nr:unnamed protein product [Callosobruchus analis]
MSSRAKKIIDMVHKKDVGKGVNSLDITLHSKENAENLTSLDGQSILVEYIPDCIDNDPKPCCSTSSSSVNPKTNVKKRRSNPLKWKKNLRKMKKYGGEEYVSVSGKVVEKKIMKAPCNEKISTENRQHINSNFWNANLTNNLKRQFLASCIEEQPVQRIRVRTGAREGKRTCSLKYFINVNGQRINVCRTYFLNTLNISQTSVRVALKKRQTGGTIETDSRGKHEPANKVGQDMRNAIREHIKKFPCIESHYSRNKSSRQYLGSYLNITQMNKLFL